MNEERKRILEDWEQATDKNNKLIKGAKIVILVLVVFLFLSIVTNINASKKIVDFNIENQRLIGLLQNECVLETPVVTECGIIDENKTIVVSVRYPENVTPKELLEINVDVI